VSASELDTEATRARWNVPYTTGAEELRDLNALCDALDAARFELSVCQGGLEGARQLGDQARAELALTATHLASARAELARWADEYACDGGCVDYPEEHCSRHGRRPAELWAMVVEVQAQRDALAAAVDGPFGAHEFTGPDGDGRTVCTGCSGIRANRVHRTARVILACLADGTDPRAHPFRPDGDRDACDLNWCQEPAAHPIHEETHRG
jgi:hypothetical protein